MRTAPDLRAHVPAALLSRRPLRRPLRLCSRRLLALLCQRCLQGGELSRKLLAKLVHLAVQGR